MKTQDARVRWNSISAKTDPNSIEPPEVGTAGEITVQAIEELAANVNSLSSSVDNSVQYIPQSKTDSEINRALENLKLLINAEYTPIEITNNLRLKSDLNVQTVSGYHVKIYNVSEGKTYQVNGVSGTGYALAFFTNSQFMPQSVFEPNGQATYTNFNVTIPSGIYKLYVCGSTEHPASLSTLVEKYVRRDGNKVLSDNNFSNDDKNRLYQCALDIFVVKTVEQNLDDVKKLRARLNINAPSQDEMDTVRAIAENKARALNFATIQSMNGWLSNSGNVSGLNIGDLLFCDQQDNNGNSNWRWNGTTIIPLGNSITLSGYYKSTKVDELLLAKQELLVSGENIKTYESEDIIGLGNIINKRATERFYGIVSDVQILEQSTENVEGAKVVYVQSDNIFAYEVPNGLLSPKYYKNWEDADKYLNTNRTQILDKIYMYNNDIYYLNPLSVLTKQDSVKFTPQNKTEEEKKIALENIGAQKDLMVEEWENINSNGNLGNGLQITNSAGTVNYVQGRGGDILTFDLNDDSIVEMSISGSPYNLIFDNEGDLVDSTGVIGVIENENGEIVKVLEYGDSNNIILKHQTDYFLAKINLSYYYEATIFRSKKAFPYYDKNQSDNRYAQSSSVFSKLESEQRYIKQLSNSLTVYRSDAVWENDLIKLVSTTQMLTDVILKVRTSNGDIFPEFKIVYNNNYAYLSCRYLSKNTNWEFFDIKYNLVNNDKTYLPSLRGKIGRNYIQDENATGEGVAYHSRFNCELFRAVYKGYGGNSRIAYESRIEIGDRVEQSQTDEVCVRLKANAISRPYGSAATSEEVMSSPDILTVASHYNNTNTRYDITPINTYLKNTIAVSAGQNSDGTGTWTSYGYGVEFFESFSDLFTRYGGEQFKTFYWGLFSGTIGADKRTITTGLNENGVQRVVDVGGINARYVGETLWMTFGSSKIEFKVAERIDDYHILADRDLFDLTNPGAIEVNGIINIFSDLNGTAPQESPVCSIVNAKFCIIQDNTNANWQLVREAAQKTASNSTYTVDEFGRKVWTVHPDDKRGFGIINVENAIEYINQWYINNDDYIDSSVIKLEQGNLLIPYEKLGNENYVPKIFLEKLLSIIPVNLFEGGSQEFSGVNLYRDVNIHSALKLCVGKIVKISADLKCSINLDNTASLYVNGALTIDSYGIATPGVTQNYKRFVFYGNVVKNTDADVSVLVFHAGNQYINGETVYVKNIAVIADDYIPTLKELGLK